MNNKILSIIIPSYNTSRFVDQCVPTFIDEALFDYVDVIFIDDGATDDTVKKLDPYLSKYPQYFHFFHKENGGHGSVINYGIYNCVKTKYFKVIDGDDYIDSKAMQSLVKYLMTIDDDLVVSGFCQKYPKSEEMITPIFEDFKNVYTEKKTYGVEIIPNLNITIHSVTFKTNIFLKNNIRLPEKVFYDDNLFILYPLPFIEKVSFIYDYVYFYRLGDVAQSVSLKGRIKHYDDAVCIRKMAYSFYENSTIQTNIYLDNFCARFLSLSLSCYRITLLTYKNNKIARQKCLEMYLEDSKNDKLLYELKKSKFHRYLFFFKFHSISFFRWIESKKYK